MAKPNDVAGDLSEAAEQAAQMREDEPDTYSRRTKEYHSQRRVEAMTLRLAGLTYQQIAERMDLSESGAYDLVKRSFRYVETDTVDEMRQLENDRLDRAQAAIWPKVLKGEESAISTFLSISGQRARINGLNSPPKVGIRGGVSTEMESAVNQLGGRATKAAVIADAQVVTGGTETSEEPRESTAGDVSADTEDIGTPPEMGDEDGETWQA